MSDPLDPPTPRRKPKPPVTQIGGRPLKPSTLMMGYGYDPVLSEGALKPPIFLTSTFAFESAAAGKRHFEQLTGKRTDEVGGLVYSRFNGPNQEILEDRLAIWDGAEDALVFSSGMSAIATLLLAYCESGDVVVHSGPLYAATESFIARTLGKYGVAYVDFPSAGGKAERDEAIARGKALAAERGGKLALIYLESPANPTNALVDIEAVAAARDALFPEDGPPIAIDNTFLGPLFQTPLEHGADIVVYSLTKYVGGHSDLVAGGVSGAARWIAPVRALRNTMGTICDPNTAWMLLRSLETVELRMLRSAENAAKLCDFLKDHPKVEGLGFLGLLPPGPRREVYERHCKGPGSTFSLFIRGGEAEAFRFLDALRVAKLAVSLGGTETLASHPAAMTHLSVSEDRRAMLGISDNLVRISVGIEDADDLIADFAAALEQV
jgi:methionine-gamma-lyase